jgi:hypothetical protein
MLSLGRRYFCYFSHRATEFIARHFYQIFTEQPLDFGRAFTQTHWRMKFKIKRLGFHPAVFALTRAGMKIWSVGAPGQPTDRLAGSLLMGRAEHLSRSNFLSRSFIAPWEYEMSRNHIISS